MTVGVVIVVLLAVAGLVFVVTPLFRHKARSAPGFDDALATERDLQARHEMLLSSLRDLEEDHLTDKIDEADYAQLHARLTSRTVEVMKQLDQLRIEREERERLPAPLQHPGARPRNRTS